MKVLYFFSFILLIAIPMKAQPWNPVIVNDTAYFAAQVPASSMDSVLNGYVTSISVTNLTTQGSTKIFQFPYSMRREENNVFDSITGDRS